MEKSASIGSPRFGLEAIRDLDRRRLLKELLTILEGFFGEDLVSVVVFGSVARGDAKPGSDTDVLVVARNIVRATILHLAHRKLTSHAREPSPSLCLQAR
jgi:predicted nucleotidyltransferase